jgi:iodotyrosine deiodinase
MSKEEQKFVPFSLEPRSEEQRLSDSQAFYDSLNKRRTVRTFKSDPIRKEVIENILLAAGTAPSGAHKQPWTFCVVSDPKLKSKIRAAAEKEEYENYHGRMSEEWLEDLKKFGTDWHKPFIEIAPYIIIVFKKTYDLDEEGQKRKNYYVQESVGIACGMLLAAIHNAGLASLTHTPSPMNFLGDILNRPKNEKPFLLIPVGLPADDAVVPVIERKPLKDISQFYE